MTEYKVYKSRAKAVKLLLGSLAFVALGIFLLNTKPENTLIGWLSIGFFGLGIPLALYQLLDRRPELVINEIGIFHRQAHKDVINWELIHDAYLLQVYGQKFLCLVLPEEFRPSKSRSKLYQQAVKVTEALGFQEVNLPLGTLNIDAERLGAFILAMRGASAPQRPDIIARQLQGAD